MFKKAIRVILPVILAAFLITSVSTLSVGALNGDVEDIFKGIEEIYNDLTGNNDSDNPDVPDDSDEQEPTYYDEPTVPETEAPVETEPPEETEPPVIETDPPVTEYIGGGGIDNGGNNGGSQSYTMPVRNDIDGINSVKMDKSVSNKSFSSDNTAGIVSWICVAVGIVVIMVMLVSTKVSGRRGV